MKPLIDYAPPTNTRAERRHRIFLRCARVVSGALLVLSLWDFTASVIDHFARMAQIERAAQLGKGTR